MTVPEVAGLAPELEGAKEGQGSKPLASASERFHQEFLTLIQELDKTLAPEQRNRAVANFRRYAEDFSVLARRARAEPPRK